MKLRLASLDVRITHVHGVGVAVHNHGPWSFRLGNSGCKTWFSLCRTSSAYSSRFSAVCQPVRYTLLLLNSVSHISSSQWAVQL